MIFFLLCLRSYHGAAAASACHSNHNVYGLGLQVAQLVTDLLKGLPRDVLSQLTVICSSEDAAQALQQRQQHAKHTFRAISLGEAFLEPISALLIIVGASKDEVSLGPSRDGVADCKCIHLSSLQTCTANVTANLYIQTQLNACRLKRWMCCYHSGKAV